MSSALLIFALWCKVIYKRKDATADSHEETESHRQEVEFDSEEQKCDDGTVLKKRRKAIVIRYVLYQQCMDSENYFREALMLFYPWRTETNLIGKCETYQERFEKLVKTSDIKIS